MADVATLLAGIPEGSQYNALRATIERIGDMFPGELPEITTGRVAGWVNEIDTGSGKGRDADGIRDDIFKYIVGPEVIQEVLGVTPEQAQQLILGGNDGGINFSDLQFDEGGSVITPDTGPQDTTSGDLAVTPGAPGEEDQDQVGIGGAGTDEDDEPLTILTSEEMEWFFDESNGKWYVSYGLPNSDRSLVFEADPDQMDSLFGEGFRPTQFSRRTIGSLLGDENYTFGNNIAAMSGTGQFEDEIARVQAIALDNGTLPDWADSTGEIMDLVYVAQSQDKTQDWLYDKIAMTDEFKARFPQIQEFKSGGNLTLKDAISGYLEFEAGIRGSLRASGLDEGLASPEVVGGLLNKGYHIETVTQAVTRWGRMKDFAPAMAAFNEVLVAQGLEPIESLQDQFDFLSGTAPAEVYEIWEASSVAEAASAAGLGDLFTAEDAMRFATATEGHTSLEDATGMFGEAAKLLLRMRHEVAVDKFNINTDDLIDLSLGQPPRSGTSGAELAENINRAILSAQGSLKAKAQPFTGFSSEGRAQLQSLGGLRDSA